MEKIPETPKQQKPITARRVNFSDLPAPEFDEKENSPESCSLSQTPENTSDEFSESESTVISVSSIDTSDDELYSIEAERKKIEKLNKISYRGNLGIFKTSMKTICRQLRMLHFVSRHYNESKIEDETKDEKSVKQLRAIQRTIERRTSYVLPHFGTLFQIHRFLENTPANILIENQKLTEALCDLIESWLKNPTFHYQNYEKLLYFLRGFYEDHSCHSLKSVGPPTLYEIKTLWHYSYYFDQENYNEKIILKNDYIGACYFSIILEKFDEKLTEAAYPIPAVIELASKLGLDFFDQFLRKFKIPFSGPFKSFDLSQQKISYFVSSVNPADSITNNFVPLYGPYAFDLSSLPKLETETALKIWERLEEIPFWLTYIPPAFNLSLNELRDQLFTDN